MLGMSPLQFKLYITIALAAALAVFELVTRISDKQKIRDGAGQEPDPEQDGPPLTLVKKNAVRHSRSRIWTEGLLVILTGASMVLTMMSLMNYQDHGAFYDASWRSPDVEDHFYFSAKDNMDLEGKYLSAPEEFDWTAHNIVLVKMGCEDCERVQETVQGLADRGYKIVFSTSDLGKAYVERYGVTYVPSAILANSLVVQLRSGDAMLPDGDFIAPELQTDGEKAQSILDDLMKPGSGSTGGLATDENGNDPAAADPNYTKYGTKAAIEWAMEQEALRQEQEASQQDSGSQEPVD